MSAVSKNFGEARQDVLRIMAADDPVGAAVDYCELMDDPSRLKVAEYALLVPSVRIGMEHYLETATHDSGRLELASGLVGRIGRELGGMTISALEENPHFGIIDTLAKRRSELVQYGKMIYPVSNNVFNASAFSADAMFGVAVSNALVINAAAGNEPRADFIDAVKRSHQPAIARAVAHLQWNPTIGEELSIHASSLKNRTAMPNANIIAYDPKQEKAVLAQPLQRWWISDMGKQVLQNAEVIGGIDMDDARVGCPFSFEPELLKQYYEHIVDAIEAAEAWPYTIAKDGSPITRSLGLR